MDDIPAGLGCVYSTSSPVLGRAGVYTFIDFLVDFGKTLLTGLGVWKELVLDCVWVDVDFEASGFGLTNPVPLPLTVPFSPRGGWDLGLGVAFGSVGLLSGARTVLLPFTLNSVLSAIIPSRSWKG